MLNAINKGEVEGLAFQGNDLSFYQTTKQIRRLDALAQEEKSFNMQVVNIPSETKSIDKIIIQDYQTVIDNNLNNGELYRLYEKIVMEMNKRPNIEKNSVKRENKYGLKQLIAGTAMVAVLFGAVAGANKLASELTNTEPDGPYKGSDYDTYQELTPEEESMRNQILENAGVSLEEEPSQHSRTL